MAAAAAAAMTAWVINRLVTGGLAVEQPEYWGLYSLGGLELLDKEMQEVMRPTLRGLPTATERVDVEPDRAVPTGR